MKGRPMSSRLQSEILEQPDGLNRLLEAERANFESLARVIRERNPRFVMLVARGTSDNAARYSQYLFSTINGLPAALATPSSFTLYQQPPRLNDALVIAISQSGQSPDIITVIKEGRRQGALTLALTNVPGSPLAAAAEYNVALHAGQEHSVAATKTYTASLMALAMLSTALANDSLRMDQLAQVPKWVEAVTARCKETIDAAERYAYIQYCVVASRGYNYATAYEIALKLKELTYVIAEPYSSADFQHGPLALVEHNFPVVAIVPEGALAPELVGFFRQLKERGADLIVISALEEALQLAQTPLPLPASIPEWLSPIVAVVPGQMFALGLTLAKRFDPDHPRSIRKVTLTV
jgi:glucosamine--fructose-6-phosphate aminotransferase (isomerizing)